jgi:hypothetical protein
MDLKTRAKHLVILGNDLYRGGHCSEAEFAFSKAIHFFELAGVAQSTLKRDAEEHLCLVYRALGRPEDASRCGR